MTDRPLTPDEINATFDAVENTRLAREERQLRREEAAAEAAEKFTALAENAHMEALSNDDIGHASGLENAAAELRRMADETAQ